MVSKYDKDKNYLLSVKEIGIIFKKELAYELNEDDMAMVTQNLRSMFDRTELKRAEFKKFVEQQMKPVKFEASEAVQLLVQIGLITKMN